MKPKRRQQIDMSHALLMFNLYPENHVFRRKIDEAFLITERPSKSEIDSVTDMFYKSNRSLPFSILAIYDSQFSIQEDLDDEWLGEEVDRMADHLLYYPKLAYVNYLSYEGPYRQAIINFDDILKVDEYNSFWLDFNAGIKGSADSNLTQIKLQLKQEVKQELKDQLKQEVKSELKHQLEQEVKQALMQSCGDNVRNMVNNATDKILATFEGAKRQLRNDLRSIMMAEIRREFDRSSETQ